MKKVARGLNAGVLMANGFKDDEFILLKNELARAGFKMHVISPETTIKSERIFLSELLPGAIQGIMLKPDVPVEEAVAANYDLLVVPGGAFSAYKLASNDDCIHLIRDYLNAGKVMGALSDGSRILKETGLTEGKHITIPEKYLPLLVNSGLKLEDQPVVSDDGLVTCQTSRQIQDFMSEMLHFLLVKKVYTDYLISLKNKVNA